MNTSRHHRSSTIQSAINTAVYTSIFDEQHYIDPPKVSPELWDYVSIYAPGNRAESERLEFLGDALMDACIAIELYKIIPDGNPHKYTEVRSVLHSNFTFSHVVQKMGLKFSADTKSIGDIFETLIGAYYTERGFDALHTWVKRSFEPVIDAAAAAFDRCQSHRMKTVDEPPKSPVIGEAPSTSSTLPTTGSATTAGKRRSRRRSSVTVGRSTLVRECSTNDDAAILPESSDDCPELNTYEKPATIGMPPRQRPPSENSNSVATLGSPSTVRGESPSASFITSPWSNESDDEDEDDSDESLPEFWEELHLPDGKTLYLDHRTETTSWERPRRNRGFKLTDPEESWTARLHAPLPEVPEVDTYSTRAREDPWSNVAPSVLSHEQESLNTDIVGDLLRDGYSLGDRSTDDFSQPGAVPDFWEVRRGTDGHTYYIDHPASIILRSRQSQPVHLNT